MIDYCKNNLKLLKSQGFSEKAVEDLAKSGLTLETVKRMGLLPLTPENFKKYLHYSLIEKPTRSPIVNDGYIIPYHHITPKFVRVEVIEWNRGSSYYQKVKDDPPKYLQPSKQHLERSVHIYFLPETEKRQKSPKSVYFITEGEKKTAKLQQELEKLETDYRKFAALGLGGVWNWSEVVFEEMEWMGADFKDRTVFICFDADAVVEDELLTSGNTSVAKAEITLYAYLLSKGATSVKSLVWDFKSGKGIDDYLVRKEEEGTASEEALKELIKEAVSPIEKYKNSLSIDTVLECLAKYLTELPGNVVEELKSVYGVGKSEIKKKFKKVVSERRKELEEKLKREEREELLKVYRELFGIDFIPEIPKGFERDRGQLLYKGEAISEFFVVSEVRENADEIDGGYIATLNFISGKKFDVDYTTISSYKLLGRFFNKKVVHISESEARKVQDYISRFIRLNKLHILKDPYSSRLG